MSPEGNEGTSLQSMWSLGVLVDENISPAPGRCPVWTTAQTRLSLPSHPPLPQCSSHSCARKWPARALEARATTKFTWASSQFHLCVFCEPGSGSQWAPPFPAWCRVPLTHPHPLCWEDKPKVRPPRPGVLPTWPRATAQMTWGEFFHAGLIQGWESWHPAPVLGGRERAKQHARDTRSSPTQTWCSGKSWAEGGCRTRGSLEVLGQSPGWAGGGLSLSRKGEASRHDCI